MKQIFAAVLIIFSSFVHAAPFPVTEKVLAIFKQSFPQASNVKWYEGTDYNEVFFVNRDIVCRVRYDADGNVLYARRDYYEKDLCPFIKGKLMKKYPDKTIYGITETTSDEGINYAIILQDDKTLYFVSSNAIGELTLTKKLRRANS